MIKERICFAALFAVEAVIIWFYYKSIYQSKRTGLILLASFTVGYVFLFFLSELKIPALNLLLFMLVNFILIISNYKCSLTAAVLHAAFLTFCNAVAEVLVNLGLMSFGVEYNSYTQNFTVMLALIILSKFLFVFIVFFAANILKPRAETIDETKPTLLLGIMPLVSSFVVVTIAYIAMSTELLPQHELMVSISMLALLLVNIALMILHGHIRSIAAENMALSVGKVQDEAHAEYYKLLKEQYDSQRILIHDIKQHLNSVRDMLKFSSIDEVEQYLSELEGLPALKPTMRLCDDPLLNVILSKYIEQARVLGINFFYNIVSSNFSFMDAASITALFSNLLSNAVEAAQNSSRKQIELSIKRNLEEEFILISLSNSCDIAPILDNAGLFISTKNNHELHGYGQRSIERVIRKYDGLSALRCDADNSTFNYTIRLPYENLAGNC